MFLDECLYNIEKWSIMTELTFLKELMLIKEAHQNDVCHYWYFLNSSFTFQPNIFNNFYNLLMMSVKLRDIAILNVKGSDYCCIISLISKNEPIKLLQNCDLAEKSGT